MHKQSQMLRDAADMLDKLEEAGIETIIYDHYNISASLVRGGQTARVIEVLGKPVEIGFVGESALLVYNSMLNLHANAKDVGTEKEALVTRKVFELLPELADIKHRRVG